MKIGDACWTLSSLGGITRRTIQDAVNGRDDFYATEAEAHEADVERLEGEADALLSKAAQLKKKASVARLAAKEALRGKA